jgi:hypothetical protein
MKRAIAAAALAIASACGGASEPGGKVGTLAVSLPQEMLGLRLAPEDVSKGLSVARPSYVEALGLYSLRSDDLLQATLQVGRFRPGVDSGRASFRSAIVGRIGSSVPRAFRLGDDTVYLTAGTRQRIAVWFRGRYQYVLAVRDDFREWRTLLRQALEIRL